MLDIVVFFIITVFIALKLRSVLGTRNENDDIRQKTLEEFFKSKAMQNDIMPSQNKKGEIIDITGQIDKKIKEKPQNITLSINVADSVKKELIKINFNETNFLKGAENVVEMVNDSFSNKDLETLKELLNVKVYNNFKQQIDELNQQNRILKSSLISFLSKKIDNIKIDNKIIFIDVIFEMEQINFIEDKDGNIVMGNKKKIQIIKEKWTFERKVNNKNNFWLIDNIENVN